MALTTPVLLTTSAFTAMSWQQISYWQCLGLVSLTTSHSLLPSPARAAATAAPIPSSAPVVIMTIFPASMSCENLIVLVMMKSVSTVNDWLSTFVKQIFVTRIQLFWGVVRWGQQWLCRKLVLNNLQDWKDYNLRGGISFHTFHNIYLSCTLRFSCLWCAAGEFVFHLSIIAFLFCAPTDKY